MAQHMEEEEKEMKILELIKEKIQLKNKLSGNSLIDIVDYFKENYDNFEFKLEFSEKSKSLIIQSKNSKTSLKMAKNEEIE